mgnify:CR=1 FL=1
MISFRNHRLRDLTLPTSTAWLLTDIAEAKGKQELYTRQSPQILKALRDTAIIQSAESSNRIEGVTVDRDRLRPLILGNARPRDRSEEEVIGYRRALNEIHAKAAGIPINAATLRHLHALCQHGSGDAAGRKALSDNLPTSGLAIFDFEVDDWGDVAFRRGRLARFVSPRLLKQASGD